MKHRLLSILLAASGALAATTRAEDAPPTGEEILKLVRVSNALQNYKLTGTLRDDRSGKSESFTLNMEQNIMRFRFSNPSQIVHLDMTTSPASLKSVQAGGSGAVPLAKYGEKVRGFAMNYEDLSLRFLYWPGAKLLGEENYKLQKCWKVRVTSPDSATPYGTVDLWVHQASGGMAKMDAYDLQGRHVKHYEVSKIQKVDGATILKEMKVESFSPGSTKSEGRTYMTLDNPERN
ncbi:MAG: outer membrane lipoprotein-sorting protein [Verrucomicrobiaceae bacterium]|nr:outer membrane lipoprotein-sorting protein [Verrucomicrobiaceae bacterium]